MRLFFTILINVLFSLSLIAQDPMELQFWSSTGVQLKVHKKLSFGTSYFTAYNFEDQRISFTQLKGYTSYSPWRGTYFGLGYLMARSTRKKTNSHRIYGSMSYAPKGFPIRQYLIVEQFFPKLKKYGTRINYAIRVKKTLIRKPFRMAPYTTARLFYFLGGRSVSHYDETGEFVVKQPSNGLHRFRWTSGIHFKPHSLFYFKLYMIFQKEFNIGLLPYRDLHIVNPRTEKVTNRFNNYWVIGLSIQFRFKSYE